MRTLITCSIILFGFVSLFANTSGVALVDSLAQVPYPAMAELSRTELLERSKAFDFNNPRECIHLSIQLLQNEKKFDLTATEKNELHLLIAKNLWATYVDNKAYEYLSAVSTSDNNILSIHRRFFESSWQGFQGDYEALESGMKEIIPQYRAVGEKRMMIRAMGALAHNYEQKENYQQAFIQYEKALRYIDTANNCYNQHMVVLYNYTRLLFKRLPYQKEGANGLSKINSALSLFESKLNKCPSLRLEYGYVRFRLQYNLAIHNMNQAKANTQRIKEIMDQSPRFFTFYHYALGNYMIASYHAHPQVADYEKAIQYGKLAEKHYESQPSSALRYFYMNELYSLMFDVAAKSNKAQLAVSYLAKLNQLNQNYLEKVQQSETKKEERLMTLELMRIKEDALEKNNLILWRARIVIFMLLIIASLIALGIYRMNIKNQNQLIEIQALNSDLQRQVELIEAKSNELTESNRTLEIVNQRRAKLLDRLQSFSFVIMNDFKAPIRSVHTYSRFLLQRLGGALQDTDREYLNYLNNGSKRLNRMIDVVQQFNINNISLCQDLQFIDLNDTLNQLYQDLSDKFKTYKASLSIVSDLPQVYGGPQLLYQLFKIIINNSLEYHRPGIPPRISIRYKKVEQYHVIIIDDNGIGIKEEFKKDLLTLFRPLENISIEDVGMGLAMCKEIMDIHDGKLSITRKQEVGTRVTIHFPVHNNLVSLDDKVPQTTS